MLRKNTDSRVFQNKGLRRKFGSERTEVINGWKKLHKKELRNLYSPQNIIRMIILRM
jgi:hypothetical protein